MKKKPVFALSVLLSISLILSCFSFVSADGKVLKNVSDSSYYFVQFKDQPVATYQGGVSGYASTMKGTKLNISNPAVKKYRNYLDQHRLRYKNWLKTNVRSAEVATEFSLAFNGVGVKATASEAQALAKGPGVVRVVKSKRYKPLMNRSNDIIGTAPAWKSGFKGAGIKIAVIDSGIDQDHPFLKDNSLPKLYGFPKVDKPEWLKYTSKKVIVAKVFSPDSEATPEALGDHGSHVSGTISGRAGYADPMGRTVRKLSGVAPKAYLGSYNVFPCKEDEPCGADSIYIAKALEEAVNDGMDVANLSLGSTATPGFDMLVEVINAVNKAGMVTVISAGNSGPGPETIGSPGIAEEAITVAAVHNSHFFGHYVKVEKGKQVRRMSIGSGDPGGQITKKLTAPLAVVKEHGGLGCSEIKTDVKGKVAVVRRGGCTFTEKANFAKEKGALGVVIVNNKSGDPVGMAVESTVTIPVVMVSEKDGAWMKKGKSNIVFEPGKEKEFKSSELEEVADFSSRGPTVNYTLKPDVAAVGANVFSSVVGGGLESFNGTSMAAPHVTGAVALLMQAHPDWTPRDVKAALIGTGRNPKGNAFPTEVGGGIIDIGKALYPVALASPASLSLGKFNRTKQKTVRVEVKNTSSSFHRYTIKAEKGDLSFNKQRISLSNGNKGAFLVTVRRGQVVGEHQGYITLSTNGGSIRVPYYYVVE